MDVQPGSGDASRCISLVIVYCVLGLCQALWVPLACNQFATILLHSLAPTTREDQHQVQVSGSLVSSQKGLEREDRAKIRQNACTGRLMKTTGIAVRHVYGESTLET